MENKNTRTEEIVRKEEGLTAFVRSTKMRHLLQCVASKVSMTETTDETQGGA